MSLRRPAYRRHRGPIVFDENTVFQELMDCLDCGECCHARDGTILIVDKDIEKWRLMGETDLIDSLAPGHFGQLSFPMSADHRCIYQGTPLSPNACSIYEKRATICRKFAMLCPQCLDIRRNRHLPL